jgi:hypothetical protein
LFDITGYAVFGAVSAVRVLKEQGVSHGRIVIMIEACEESGSQDLMYYVNELEKEIGIPTLVLCLDSGCGNYEQVGPPAFTFVVYLVSSPSVECIDVVNNIITWYDVGSFKSTSVK